MPTPTMAHSTGQRPVLRRARQTADVRQGQASEHDDAQHQHGRPISTRVVQEVGARDQPGRHCGQCVDARSYATAVGPRPAVKQDGVGTIVQPSGIRHQAHLPTVAPTLGQRYFFMAVSTANQVLLAAPAVDRLA